jgi:hypothetical protein
MNIKLNRTQLITILVALITIPALLLLVDRLFFQMNYEWEHEWLNDIPCVAPCWYNITPGITTASEAEKLLRQHPQIVDLESVSPTEDSAAYSWSKWKDSYGGGDVFYFKPNSIVYEITFATDHYFSLNDVTSRFGEPSHVYAIARHDVEHTNEIHYRFNLYFESVGLGLIWSPRSQTERPTLEPTALFREVIFFQPDYDGLLATFPYPQNTIYLVPWKGFLDFRDYCVSTDENPGDKNPCES